MKWFCLCGFYGALVNNIALLKKQELRVKLVNMNNIGEIL